MDDSLTSFIEEICGDSHLRVETDLGDGFVRLRVAEAERRQAKQDIRGNEDVVIELLRNARDAGARNIFLASSREETCRLLTIIDDGQGVPEGMQSSIFEPRVTSKLDTMHFDSWGVHGRGMALYSIAQNSYEAFIALSEVGKGSAFVVKTDSATLGEKSDQSTLPSFSYDEEGKVVVKGIRNINRMVAEFAYENKEKCNVFYGSPTEIVASIYHYGEATLSSHVKAFCTNEQDLQLIKRLAFSADPDDLALRAESLGLNVSSRSARRILDGDLPALEPMVELIEAGLSASTQHISTSKIPGKACVLKDERGIKIHEDDMETFRHAVKKAYGELAEAYYLEASVDPEISVSPDEIRLKIPVIKLR